MYEPQICAPTAWRGAFELAIDVFTTSNQPVVWFEIIEIHASIFFKPALPYIMTFYSHYNARKASRFAGQE